MKLWQIAALLVGVGIVYVLVKRPQITSTIGPATSNSGVGSTFAALLNFGTALTNKISPPSASDPSDAAAIYRPGESFEDYTSRLFGPGTEG